MSPYRYAPYVPEPKPPRPPKRPLSDRLIDLTPIVAFWWHLLCGVGLLIWSGILLWQFLLSSYVWVVPLPFAVVYLVAAWVFWHMHKEDRRNT